MAQPGFGCKAAAAGARSGPPSPRSRAPRRGSCNARVPARPPGAQRRGAGRGQPAPSVVASSHLPPHGARDVVAAERGQRLRQDGAESAQHRPARVHQLRAKRRTRITGKTSVASRRASRAARRRAPHTRGTSPHCRPCPGPGGRSRSCARRQSGQIGCRAKQALRSAHAHARRAAQAAGHALAGQGAVQVVGHLGRVQQTARQLRRQVGWTFAPRRRRASQNAGRTHKQNAVRPVELRGVEAVAVADPLVLALLLNANERVRPRTHTRGAARSCAFAAFSCHAPRPPPS